MAIYSVSGYPVNVVNDLVEKGVVGGGGGEPLSNPNILEFLTDGTLGSADHPTGATYIEFRLVGGGATGVGTESGYGGEEKIVKVAIGDDDFVYTVGAPDTATTLTIGADPPVTAAAGVVAPAGSINGYAGRYNGFGAGGAGSAGQPGSDKATPGQTGAQGIIVVTYS